MKLVNADNPTLKSHSIYHKIKQPMPIYHGTEELYANESKPTVVFKEDLFDKYKAITFPPDSYYFPINSNTFVGTGEKFVPLTFTREGFIIYETVGMKVKRVDNCYTRLYGIMYMPGGAKSIVTSTGLWSLRPDSACSAAVPPKLLEERNWNMTLNREIRQRSVNKIKDKLKTSKKLSVMDYKFISKLLNPLAGDFFLNPMLAAKDSYRPNANPMTNNELMEVLASERVQRLILKELGVVMPELAKAIQKQSDPEAVATMLKSIADQAIGNQDLSVEDKLLSVQAILNAGYPEEGVTLNPPRELGNGIPNFIGGPQPPAQNLIPYTPDKVMGMDEVNVEKPDKPDNMSDEEFKKASDDAGAMDGYTFENVEEEVNADARPSAN